MTKIAICDDFESDIKELKEKIKEVWENQVEISVFTSGASLIRAVEQEEYAIIFLDIFLENENGIEAAREVKNLNSSTEIVFVSTSREFGPEAFEINALYYLVKPVEREKLEEIKKRFDRKRGNQATVTVRLHGREQEIPLYLLSYAESVHNNLRICLKNGTAIQIRGSIQEFQEELDSRFLKINRGTVVNMEAIESMDGETCEIAGERLPISRSRRAECRKIYNDYLFNAATGKQI